MKPEDIKWLDEEDLEEPADEEESVQPEEEEPTDEKPPRRYLWLIILAALVLVAGALYVTGAYRRLFGISSYETLEAEGDPIAYTPDSQTHVQPFGKLALHLSADGAQAWNSRGELVWDQPYTMSSPSLSVAGGYAAVTDLGGRQILLLDEQGLVQTITTEGTLLAGTVNASGDTAVIMQNGDGNMLAVYDAAGQVRVRRVTYSDQDGMPLSIAINEDASCMATAYAIYTESALRSAVTLFNLTDTASDSIDRIAGNYNFEDTLVTDIRYLGDELVVVGDNLLAGIQASGNTKEDWRESLSYQIEAISFGDDFLAVRLGAGLIGVAGEPEFNLLLIGSDGSHRLEKKLALPKQLIALGDALVYQDGFEYYAVNAQGGERWRYTVENGMQLYALPSGLALGNTGSAMQFYQVVTVDAQS